MKMSKLLEEARQRNLEVDVLAKMSRDWLCNAERYVYKTDFWDEPDSYETVVLSTEYDHRSLRYKVSKQYTAQEIEDADDLEDFILLFDLYKTFR